MGRLNRRDVRVDEDGFCVSVSTTAGWTWDVPMLDSFIALIAWAPEELR